MKKLTFFHWLIIALILVLIINTVTHFTHPAYKFYRENFEQLRESNEVFEKRVLTEVVTAIVTNSSFRSSSVVTNVSISQTSSVSSVMRGESVATNSTYSLDFRFFVSQSLPCFEYQGRSYFLTDDFYGSPLIYISPTIVKTSTSTFVQPLRSAAAKPPAVSPPSEKKNTLDFETLLKYNGIKTDK